MDREKEMRQKLQSQQKLYSDSMDSLQVSTIYGYIDIIVTLLFIYIICMLATVEHVRPVANEVTSLPVCVVGRSNSEEAGVTVHTQVCELCVS